MYVFQKFHVAIIRSHITEECYKLIKATGFSIYFTNHSVCTSDATKLFGVGVD